MQIPEVDETIKRLSQHKGVAGVIVAARDGVPIRTTIDNTSTVLYVNGMMSIEDRCSSIVRDIDPLDQLRSVRIRSRRFEIMLTTEEEYLVIVIQNPTET